MTVSPYQSLTHTHTQAHTFDDVILSNVIFTRVNYCLREIQHKPEKKGRMKIGQGVFRLQIGYLQ